MNELKEQTKLLNQRNEELAELWSHVSSSGSTCFNLRSQPHNFRIDEDALSRNGPAMSTATSAKKRQLHSSKDVVQLSLQGTACDTDRNETFRVNKSPRATSELDAYSNHNKSVELPR